MWPGDLLVSILAHPPPLVLGVLGKPWFLMAQRAFQNLVNLVLRAIEKRHRI